jgi:hypothetical protein
MPTNDLSLLRPEALAQLGTLLANAQKALKTLLRPEHLYVGRYGHTAAGFVSFIRDWVGPFRCSRSRQSLRQFMTRIEKAIMALQQVPWRTIIAIIVHPRSSRRLAKLGARLRTTLFGSRRRGASRP